MSQPIVKIENLDALNTRDKKNQDGKWVRDESGTSGIPGRWPGKVTKKLGNWVQNGFESGEFKVEITSKYLEDPVIGKANVEREVGTRVQFSLNPEQRAAEDPNLGPAGKFAETIFEFTSQIDSRTNEPLPQTEQTKH